MNKFCKKCGTVLADDAKFCEECGMQVTQTAQKMDQTYAEPHAQPQYQFQSQKQGVDLNKYSKMGGWLLFFVVLNMLGILSGLGTAGKEIQDTASVLSEWYGYGIFTTLCINILAQTVALAAITFSILFIIQVFKRKSLFLRFIQIGSILSLASSIITIYVCSQIGWGNYESSFIGNIVGSIIGSVAGFFLMTLYYCKSIRVRTYMGSDEYMQKAIFAYKQPPIN